MLDFYILKLESNRVYIEENLKAAKNEAQGKPQNNSFVNRSANKKGGGALGPAIKEKELFFSDGH